MAFLEGFASEKRSCGSDSPPSFPSFEMALCYVQLDSLTRDSGSASKHVSYISRAGEYARGRPHGRERDRCLHVDSAHMPAWALDAEGHDAENARAAGGRYWQAADAGERVNGRLAVKLMVALPVELHPALHVPLARELALRAATLADGSVLPVTWAIHEGKGTNPHVHLVISERINDGHVRSESTWFRRAATGAKPIESGGARKTRELTRDWIDTLRNDWAEMANGALERAGHSERMDPRSNLERGIEDLSAQHVGWGPSSERRRRENLSRQSLNAALRNLRAERARVEAEQDTDQADGLAQHEVKNDDQRHPDSTGLPRLQPDQLEGAAAGTAPGDTGSTSDAVSSGAAEPDVVSASGTPTAAGETCMLHLPGSGLDGQREREHTAGVLHGDQNDVLDSERPARNRTLRRAPAGNAGDAEHVVVGELKAAKASVAMAGLGAAAGNQLLNAQRGFAAIGQQLADKFQVPLARMRAAEAAKAIARKAGVQGDPNAMLGQTSTLAKVPSLAAFTTTSLRSLVKLSDRDLREQLEIAEKGLDAGMQVWRAALESGDRQAIAAARAQHAARRARVGALSAEIKVRAETTQAAGEGVGVDAVSTAATEGAAPANAPAAAPARNAAPAAMPRQTSVVDLSDADLALHLQGATALKARAGQEVVLRGAIAQALQAREHTRVHLESAGWWGRRSAQNAHDLAAAAVTAAINVAKRDGVRFGTRVDNAARIVTAREVHEQQTALVRSYRKEQTRRVEAAKASEQAAMPAPMPLRIVDTMRQAARPLAEIPDHDLAHQVIVARRVMDKAAKTGPAADERTLLQALLDEKERRRRAAWAEAERVRATEPGGDEESISGEDDAPDYSWVEVPR